MSASVQEALAKNGGSFTRTAVPLPVSTKLVEAGEAAEAAETDDAE